MRFLLCFYGHFADVSPSHLEGMCHRYRFSEYRVPVVVRIGYLDGVATIGDGDTCQYQMIDNA